MALDLMGINEDYLPFTIYSFRRVKAILTGCSSLSVTHLETRRVSVVLMLY